MLASVRHSRVGQRDCDVFSNKQQIAALLWNEKLNINPQIVRRLLQHSASDSLSHHHSKGSRCSVACSPFRFAIFHVHFYDSTQDATKTSGIFIHYTLYIYGESSQRQDHLLAVVCGDKDEFLCESRNQQC